MRVITHLSRWTGVRAAIQPTRKPAPLIDRIPVDAGTHLIRSPEGMPGLSPYPSARFTTRTPAIQIAYAPTRLGTKEIRNIRK